MGDRIKTKALYAGSFDPITLGHIDIINKALATFDEVHIGIGTNPKKKRLFEVDHSLSLIASALGAERLTGHTFKDDYPTGAGRSDSWFEFPKIPGLTLGEFTRLSITEYAERVGATHIVRGLRQVSDFNDEFSLRGAVEHMAPKLIMVHLICDAKFLHVSSSTARELASLGHDVSWLVTDDVNQALKGKFNG